jgi:excisionase family DNA binding protein
VEALNLSADALVHVLREPETLSSLARGTLVALRRQAAHLLADLDAHLAAQAPQATLDEAPKILTVSEAALMLRCSEDALYRKHKRLRLGFVDPLDRKLKFPEADLRAYLARQGRLAKV